MTFKFFVFILLVPASERWLEDGRASLSLFREVCHETAIQCSLTQIKLMHLTENFVPGRLHSKYLLLPTMVSKVCRALKHTFCARSRHVHRCKRRCSAGQNSRTRFTTTGDDALSRPSICSLHLTSTTFTNLHAPQPRTAEAPLLLSPLPTAANLSSVLLTGKSRVSE